MNVLKIADIREWLIENRNEYQKLKAQGFPPFDNEVYWMYIRLHRFIEYYPCTHKCDKVLKDFKLLLNGNFSEIINWTKVNTILGSQELLMFKIDYFDWKEDVNEHLMKIHEGLYTERKPFANIICFSKIFQLLYWDNNIHETILREQEQSLIRKDLQSIYENYFLDVGHK